VSNRLKVSNGFAFSFLAYNFNIFHSDIWKIYYWQMRPRFEKKLKENSKILKIASRKTAMNFNHIARYFHVKNQVFFRVDLDGGLV